MAGPDINQAAEFFNRYRRFGGSDPALSELLGDDELMKWWIDSLNERRNANPYKITVQESLERLRAAFSDTFCPMGAKEPTPSELTHLERMAPDWPKGKDAFRSFQVRPAAFGEGRDGVIKTFEATCASVKRIHDPKFWRWEWLLSGVHPYQGEDAERLRLLGGNEQHKPGIRWVTFDLSENRQRVDITSVRSSRSLSDAGIFAARMFPDRARGIRARRRAMAVRALRVPLPGRRRGAPERQLALQRRLGLLGALRRVVLGTWTLRARRVLGLVPWLSVREADSPHSKIDLRRVALSGAALHFAKF